ncbi:MAG: hypothetical protein PHH98_02655 [Candidatus Gracilibacteria bacterium]|nr:hypothetical protein [Candidatus Gracilibacteria bacterium]
MSDSEVTREDKSTLEFLKKKNLLLSELLSEITDYYSIYDSINNTKNLEELEKVIEANSDKESVEYTENTKKQEIRLPVNEEIKNIRIEEEKDEVLEPIPKIKLNLQAI